MSWDGRQGGLSGLVVGAIGASGLAGWWLGLEWPVRWLPGSPGLAPTTAFAFFVLGLGLVSLGPARQGRRRARVLAAAAAALLGLLSAAALAGHLRASAEPLLSLLGSYAVAGGQARTSSRTAAALLLLALGLASSLGGMRRRRLTAMPVLAAALVALVALAGNIHGAAELVGGSTPGATSLPTVAGLLAGAYGLASIDWDAWAPGVGALRDRSRRLVGLLFLVALFAPFAMDVLVEAGRRLGWYRAAFGDSLQVVTTSVLLAVAVAWVARTLAVAEQEAGARAREQLARQVAETVARNLEGQMAERQRLLAQVSEALRTRDRFIAFASHELRTPLTSLKLQVSGLLRALDGGRHDGGHLRSSLGRADQAVARLERLIANLLDASRAAEGRLQVEPRELELAGLVRAVADRFVERLARAGSTLDVQLAPVVGRGDPEALDHALSNLLDNAAKYGAGRPVRLRLVDGAAGARIEVTDEGPGVPVADRERIFQRFQRASGARGIEGLGLGLWIARQLADAMGGRLSVADGAGGRGCTFVLELPRRAEAGHDAAAAGPAAAAPQPAGRTSGGGAPLALVTEHPELDAQHGAILDELDRLRSAPPHQVWSSVDFLSWHAASHFPAEERLMEERAFPRRRAHAREHAAFLAGLTGCRAALASSGATAENVRELVALVEGWVATHLQGADAELASFLRQDRASAAEPGGQALEPAPVVGRASGT